MKFQYHLGMISGQFAQVAVVLEPVDDNSVSIKVKAKDEISRWVALKQAVVSDSSAPGVCRLIACQADLSTKVWQAQQQNEDPYISLAVERLRQIRKLYEKVGTAPKDQSFLAFT